MLAPGLALLAVAFAFAGVSAQEGPPEPYAPPIAGGWEPVRSLGQPPRWKPFLLLGYGHDRSEAGEAAGPTASLGVFRDFFNPVYGALGMSAEVYAGQRGDLFDLGLQAHLASPATFLHGGVDWNLRSGRADPTIGLSTPVRRGGWPARGSQLRIDWIPGRDRSVVLGFTFPLRQPLAGRTRSRTVDVELPDPPPGRVAPAPTGDVARAVAALTESMRWLAGLNGFFWLTSFSGLDHEANVVETRQALSDFRRELQARDSLFAGQHSYEQEVQFYHRTLDVAFGRALGVPGDDAAELGRTAADVARRAVLEEVVFPYNRAVGRYKQPDVLDGLAARARARFIAWLELRDDVRETDRAEALGVLDAWLEAFADLRGRMSRLKRDSRMHWLPLALALRLEDHETQADLDDLVERALGRGLVGGNAVLDIDAARFQAELRRTIHETETYHVLWIHDYRGRNALGVPDRIGFSQTVEGYLEALLRHVQAYDEVGRLPVFLLMLDQQFYEANDGRLWLDLLESPLGHAMGSRTGNPDMERVIAALQDSLRGAVAGSRRLQAEAEAFGADWIGRVVKVHVNVTNPSDFTFRSRRLLRRGPPLGADNLMRDHRKIVIRDVSESDPARGEVILAGVGVGEHYASPTWDDRALVLTGPAALEAKTMARGVLERHGLEGPSLPAPLRPAPQAGDYASRLRALEDRGATARVIQTHNRTGWGEKDATFLQMLLYDLAPRGTLLYVPDSLWTSYEWMAQLVSAALRGCHVYVVAPALANAPSAGFPQMAMMQELMTRLVVVAEEFGDVIAEAGGSLEVGLYARTAPLDDLAGVLADVDSTFAANAFLRDLFPFDDQALAVIRRLRDGSAPVIEQRVVADAVERLPKMHRKTQLIASASAVRALAAAPEMAEILDETFALAAGRSAAPAAPGANNGVAPSGPSARLMEVYERLEKERAFSDPILYFLTGSINKNVRSMALDGEVLAAIAGPWALQAYVDFVVLSGGVVWVNDVEDLRTLLPPYSRMQRMLGRWLYPVL